jgi:hypothetical protein
MKLTKILADRIAAKMRRDGFECSRSDVEVVWETGTLFNNEMLASRILQEFEEYGMDPNEFR